MYTTKLVKEISIETPNTVGVAAKVTGLVANQAKANIRSVMAAGFNGKGNFALITDNNSKALEALKSEYPKSQEHEVLVLNTQDALGEIAKITATLGKADLDINYIYTTYFDNQPAVVVSTSDNKKAQSLFSH